MACSSCWLGGPECKIIDDVVAARILNATLVVPKLDQRSYWKDSSDFADIFDADWFISFLSNDVKVVKDIPKNGRKSISPYRMRVPRKCNERWYEKRASPVLMKRRLSSLSLIIGLQISCRRPSEAEM